MELVQIIKETFPDIDWDKFEDIDRALNWELWNGPLPENYWTEVEPLEHYEWKGWVKACNDIEKILSPLPWTAWWDGESDCIDLISPDDNEMYWSDEETVDGVFFASDWIGPESFEEINLRQKLMHKETFSQVF